jgi:hypothetical protein
MEENNTPDEAPPLDIPPAVEITPPTKEVPAAEEPKASVAERIGGPASRLRTLRGPPVVALAALSFVLLVCTVLLALMVFAPGIAPFKLGTTKAGSAAKRDLAIETVADRFAHNFLTFDYRTIDANLQAMGKDATGSFSSQVAGLRKDTSITGELAAQQATSSGVVLGHTVRSVHGDTAVVRVFVIRSVTNKSQKAPQNSFLALDFTLVRTSKGWKVDTVHPAPTG